MSPGLITFVGNSPFCTKISKVCTSGTLGFLVGTHPHFILQGPHTLLISVFFFFGMSFEISMTITCTKGTEGIFLGLFVWHYISYYQSVPKTFSATSLNS